MNLTFPVSAVRISEENCEVRRIKSGCYMSAVDPDCYPVSVNKPVEILLIFLLIIDISQGND